MQELSLSTQIDLIELKARYAFIMDELGENFSDEYLMQHQVKQKLSQEMIREMFRILAYQT
ncbi:hypothetical protein [Pedobacter frigidisoli]|uniref:hypothetical protein n=1 Tax=Pedobacter frigidisoli TaxID=2530455 RepID=UPI0029312A41|nr:hypothetical protein [Pedobacter frigidisoli]